MVDGPFSFRDIIETEDLVYPEETRVITRRADQLQGVPASSFGLTGADNEWTGTNEFTGIPLLSGGGIQFPATQVPSANANTLDDYEEFTFTPVLQFGGANVGITYSVQLGRGTKIGNVVVYEISIALTSKGSSTGAATINGLPFTNVSTAATTGMMGTDGMTGLSGMPYAAITAASTVITLRHTVTGNSAALADTNFGAATTLRLSGVYRTT